MIYRKFIRPIISRLHPRKVQRLTLNLLKAFRNFYPTRIIIQLLYSRRNSLLETETMGVRFPNPIGLAAGFDKNAEFCDQISDIGFGFVEVGPITPKPEKDPQIANNGLTATINNLKNIRPKTIVAANLTHNVSTPDDELVSDFEKSFTLLYDFVDLFVINTSICREGKRSALEDTEQLSDVMDVILDKRLDMDRMKPVLLKISPDIPQEQLDSILAYCMSSGVDGIVAGDINTKNEKQYSKNLRLVKHISETTKGRLDIVGCGGILTPEQAKEMLDAGASLIELYTGIFLEGPVLVRKTLKHLEQEKENK